MATINPNGAVVLSDGGVPRTLTAVANEDLVHGEFVVASGAAGAFGANSSSFDTSDITVNLATVGACNGLLVQGGDSGEYVTMARRGEYLVRAAGTITGGNEVKLVSGTVPGVTNVTGSDAFPIGRALGNATSGTSNYVGISLNL